MAVAAVAVAVVAELPSPKALVAPAVVVAAGAAVLVEEQ